MGYKIRPVRSEADLDSALARIDELINAAPGSTEADELEMVSLAVQDYERRHHPIPPPDPIAMLEFLMDQHGLRATDLAEVIGSRARVSEILNRRRPLTLGMIRRLAARFRVSPAVFVDEYELSVVNAG